MDENKQESLEHGFMALGIDVNCELPGWIEASDGKMIGHVIE